MIAFFLCKISQFASSKKTKMKSNYFHAISLIALLTYACSNSNSNKDTAGVSDVTLIKQEQENNIYKETADTVSQPSSITDSKQPSSLIDWDKKIIKNASLTIEVKNYKSYGSVLNSIVKNFGGYLANEQESQSDERLENKVKIKVPVRQFQDLMTALNNSGERINNKQISSEDVTTEVVDTKSRIEAKKKIRQRYIDFLQQAKSITDILSIQKEINDVQEQIEMAEGRVEYLNHSSAYSTVDLHYYQQLKAPSTDDNSPAFSTKLSEAFKGGWEVLKNLLIVIITIWPLWIVATITALLIYKKRKALSFK
jgi:hypothetical protein